MCILIAGAGIGGLTLALNLHAIGCEVKIFEAVENLQPLGVGINLQPHAIKELQSLGLLEALDKIALRTKEVGYFSTHGKEIWREPRGLHAGYKWPQFSIHRGKFQELLLNEVRRRLGPQSVVTGAAVENWQENTDGVQIELVIRKTGKNLGSEQGSLLIGADGIHSTIRSKFYPDEGPPQWGGIIMWRGVTRAKPFLSQRTMAMAGCKKRKFVCYPIGEENGLSVVNWIADLARPKEYMWNREDWNRKGNLDDFLPQFEDWKFDWLDVPELIRNASEVFEFPMVDRDPLPGWTRGRVTLLGDAAHAMYPIGSNGATQAIIDASVLAREIRKHGKIPAALQSYEDERRPITSKIVLANRGDGPDKVMDIVEERAPNGFGNLEDVLPDSERNDIALKYKKLAGFSVQSLNDTLSILEA